MHEIVNLENVSDQVLDIPMRALQAIDLQDVKSVQNIPILWSLNRLNWLRKRWEIKFHLWGSASSSTQLEIRQVLWKLAVW
jgi:hypothetical protein